jgi:hypothetical protein
MPKLYGDHLLRAYIQNYAPVCFLNRAWTIHLISIKLQNKQMFTFNLLATRYSEALKIKTLQDI